MSDIQAEMHNDRLQLEQEFYRLIMHCLNCRVLTKNDIKQIIEPVSGIQILPKDRK